MQEPKTNADMFNYIPDEFRQYMPEKFGFPHHQPAAAPSPTPQAHPQPSHPPPQQAAYTQRNNSGELRRPKFCDAGMQTDDISPSGSDANIQDNEQARAQSDLPPRGNTPQQAREPQQQQHQQPPTGFARSFADTGSGNSPNGSFASAQAYATSGNDQGNDQRQARSNSNSMGNVRRVPIIVEGQPSSFPKESYMPHRSPPNRQSAPQQHAEPKQAPKRPPPPTAREVPIQRPAEPPSPSVVSINKIQDIQQDVLDLMFKVEQFGGDNKNDKEYKYLDEMLTRNLLKLDTIDTRGNDSIRLARKEAIKCIQASLNCLEAKVDGRPKEGVNADAPEEKTEVVKEEGAGGEVEVAEEAVAVKTPEATEEVDKSKIPIPMPPIPGQVPPPTIRDCTSDDEDASPVYVSEKNVELKTNKD